MKKPVFSGFMMLNQYVIRMAGTMRLESSSGNSDFR